MKLMILLPRVPYPLEKGDKLRAFYQIKELSKYHDIYLVALHHDALHPEAHQQLTPFCKRITFIPLSPIVQIGSILRAFVMGLPLQCGYFYHRQAERQLKRLIQEIQPDHIYCQMIRTAEYVKNLPIAKTIDYQDVLSKGMQRRCEQAAWYLKPLFRMEYRRLQRYESAIFPLFDHKTIITATDRDLIHHPQKEEIVVIANGVDFETYQHREVTPTFDLIFAGNMAYPPNVAAAEYLAKEIFPALRKRFPSLTLAIVGATPTTRVQSLAQEGITVTGWVESMPEYYAQSRIFVAPMTMGTGLQNKLIEAMAMQLPCVTSPLAGRPLAGVVAGKEIVICEHTRDYVESLTRLLTDEAYRKDIAAQGHYFVRQHYDWQRTCEELNRVICS